MGQKQSVPNIPYLEKSNKIDLPPVISPSIYSPSIQPSETSYVNEVITLEPLEQISSIKNLEKLDDTDIGRMNTSPSQMNNSVTPTYKHIPTEKYVEPILKLNDLCGMNRPDQSTNCNDKFNNICIFI